MQTLRLVVGALSIVVVVASVSRACAEGVELGARAGYGVPLGKTEDEHGARDLSDASSGMIPLQLDVGYRATSKLMVGGYVMYGFGFAGRSIKATCDAVRTAETATCGAHDVRLGLQTQYHWAPEHHLSPWVGAGIGYEWLTYTLNASFLDSSGTITRRAQGWEFLDVEIGLDLLLSSRFGLGPFASCSVGAYKEYSFACSGTACTGVYSYRRDISSATLHEWLMLGARGTFVF